MESLASSGENRKAEASAHARGILHRDLKPSNVLIDPADEPRVTDFGLAKILAEDSDLTRSGETLGSPNFMPPEQVNGETDRIGPASDLYGLGAILYHLLTGHPPFVGSSVEATLMSVREREPVPPRQLDSGIPRDLETICLKCLEKEPARRFGTALELAEELERFLRDEPILARPVSFPQRAARWVRRKPALATRIASGTEQVRRTSPILKGIGDAVERVPPRARVAGMCPAELDRVPSGPSEILARTRFTGRNQVCYKSSYDPPHPGRFALVRGRPRLAVDRVFPGRIGPGVRTGRRSHAPPPRRMCELPQQQQTQGRPGSDERGRLEKGLRKRTRRQKEITGIEHAAQGPGPIR
ncbi:MAG: serine/threonine protein kinase [Verrucomicrobia bacterium]|nr:serine/threonine protein kinase [Verrucomicrobiota bacterium]